MFAYILKGNIECNINPQVSFIFRLKIIKAKMLLGFFLLPSVFFLDIGVCMAGKTIFVSDVCMKAETIY